jgi:hypothetical protein
MLARVISPCVSTNNPIPRWREWVFGKDARLGMTPTVRQQHSVDQRLVSKWLSEARNAELLGQSFGVAQSGQNDHREAGSDRTHLLQERGSAHARHFEVGHHDVDSGSVAQCRDRLEAPVDVEDRETGADEDAREDAPHIDLLSGDFPRFGPRTQSLRVTFGGPAPVSLELR